MTEITSEIVAEVTPEKQKCGGRWLVALETLFWLAMAAAVFSYGTGPIIDPDFWWHLHSGETMLEQRGLLQADPFTFTDDGTVSNRETGILKGYWLWQVAAAALYGGFGFYGILLLKFLSVTAIVVAVAREMKVAGVDRLLGFLLLVVGFVICSGTYLPERPQIFSILFATLLLGMLHRACDGGRLTWRLPLLMALWGNVHGGFIVGDLLLGCFALGMAIELRRDGARMRPLLGWTSLAIAASFANPTGIAPVLEVVNLYGSDLMANISEFKSTLDRFRETGRWHYVMLWGVVATYFIALAKSRRLIWADLLMAVFLGYFSVMHARNAGFFGVAMLPRVGWLIQQCLTGKRLNRLWLTPLVVAIAIVPLVDRVDTFWRVRVEGWPVQLIYPLPAIDFVRTNGPRGNLFTSYEWGGYLSWQLHPTARVFIDGRVLDPRIYNEYHLAMYGRNPLDYGEVLRVFERHGVDSVLLPIYQGDGTLQRVMKAVLAGNDWVAVYVDNQAFVVVRRTPENAALIASHGIATETFKSKLLLELIMLTKKNPYQVGYFVALADMLTWLGRYDEARNKIEQITAATPNDQSLPYLRMGLRQLQRQLHR